MKTLTGKTVTVDTNELMWGRDLKRVVEDKEGVPVDQQRLIVKGVQIDDDTDLSELNLTEDSAFHLVLRLRGGRKLKLQFCVLMIWLLLFNDFFHHQLLPL